MYKMKTWKQAFLVMVYISTTAFRYRSKGHLAYKYYMTSTTIHDDPSDSNFPPEGPFMITLTMHGD